MGDSRFEELLRELRAEHGRLLLRLAEPPPLPPSVDAPARARATAPAHATGADAEELPGVPAPEPRSAWGSAARPPGNPATMVHATPKAKTTSRSEYSEVSLESAPGSCRDRLACGWRWLNAPGTSARPAKSLWGAGGDVEQRHGLAKIVTSTTFEMTMAALILLNTGCIAAEAQYRGMESGYDFGVGGPRMTVPADKAWPGADRVFSVLEVFFGILFTVELFLKLVAIPKKTLKDSWTSIDVLVVVFFWIEALASDLPFPPTLLRLARMARLLRFLRVVKTIRGFGSLYLMLQSIKGSVSALGWASVVLLLGEMMLALALNFLVTQFWEDDNFELEDRKTLYEHFGTFTKSLLTMVEMLLGNWFTITRILVSFNEWFMIIGVVHQLIFGFAVIEVISGVFLNETFKVANLDDSIMLNEVRRAKKAESEKLTEFFLKADRDASGRVDQDELKRVLGNEQVEEWLDAMGLDLSDIDRVFGMLDKDGDGQLSCDELVHGASLLKKPARAVDLAAVQAMLEDIWARVSVR